MARIRIVGSSFTAWTVEGSPIAYCIEVSHRSPQTVAPAVEVHPLNYIRPVEILVPRAITHGEIVLSVVETYEDRIWSHFGNNIFANNLEDLADVINYQIHNHTTADGGSTLELQRIIRVPANQGSGMKQQVWSFEGVRVVDARVDETARTETMQNTLQMTVWYTGMRLSGVASVGADTANGHIADKSY